MPRIPIDDVATASGVSPTVPARPRRWLLTVLALVVAAALVTAAVLVHRHNTRDRIDRAAAGDCAVDDFDRTPHFRLVPCTDPAAEYRVLDTIAQDRSCADVAGASQSVPIDEREICLGRRGVDPATAVNVARPGDCLYLARPVSSGEPLRLDCGDPRANYRVLDRRASAGTLEARHGEPCQGVADSVTHYAWTWAESGFTALGSTTILCLGNNDPGDGADCWLLTTGHMSLMGSGAVGRAIQVEGRVLTGDACEYRFADQAGTVRLAWAGGAVPYRKGAGEVVVPFRDLRATWRPGADHRVLSVWTKAPKGRLTVTVGLAGLDDEASLRLAGGLAVAAEKKLG
jgi:hypothetical protein